MVQARYHTLGEVNETLAANSDYGKSAYPERVRWYQRAVPMWLFLSIIALGVFGVLFSIGLTLHEAYDAQTAMGEHISAPPFNSLFETIHGWLAGWMWLPAHKVIGGWMWLANGAKWW